MPHRNSAGSAAACGIASPHVGMFDSLYVSGVNLGVDEMNDDMRWLAAYRILSLRTKGDSGWAAAFGLHLGRRPRLT